MRDENKDSKQYDIEIPSQAIFIVKEDHINTILVLKYDMLHEVIKQWVERWNIDKQAMWYKIYLRKLFSSNARPSPFLWVLLACMYSWLQVIGVSIPRD